ncbi:baseplate assembly protein [Spartinivicinus poritis]|uniref:Baseplate J/gp47 family protein n=1 Tax=Spartinivicinus poritis TaxID=2994640 RepID=A0ABT5UH15_9GAMM|nr:baseplate J/gp47 family protein [Spartinivicinus sp. A2-2]MDE1464787.1 baseplate J/gp47 family protein [Spartinivicinus sp. A2-2]
MSSRNAIDLSKLPPLNIIDETHYQDELATVTEKAKLPNPSPADPAYRIASAMCYRHRLLRQKINEQIYGLTLAGAIGPQLDHIGLTYYRTPRHEEETDQDFRYRLQLEYEGKSVAGPEGAYIFHALSADGLVKDVAVNSPEPVEVDLYILTHENTGQPTEALLKKVREYLEPYRPLTDKLNIKAPSQLFEYTIDAVLYLKGGPEASIVENLSRQRLQQYVIHQHYLGAQITESSIHAALTVEGVENVTLKNWTDIKCKPSEAAYCKKITLKTQQLASDGWS